MVFLLFQIGADRYALEASKLVEVLPLVNWKPIPGAASGIAGVFQYHGEPAPVIDLKEMLTGSATHLSMSTRVVVVDYEVFDGKQRVIAILAEQATATVRFSAEDFHESGVSIAGRAYLGPVATFEDSIVQWIRVESLLTAEARQQLWTQVEGVVC